MVALGEACFLGLTGASVMHAFKLAPLIAAGPLPFALTDIFKLAAMLL